jgi:hypothetical protein
VRNPIPTTFVNTTLISNSAFINKVLNFLGLGLALYSIASLYEWVSDDPIIKHTVKCKYCRKWISVKVMPPSVDKVEHLLTV